MMISKKRILWIAWIVSASMLNGCIVLSLYPDKIDYKVEIDIKEQCQRSEYSFLVFNRRQAFGCWGYELYESALTSSRQNLWLVPKELMRYSKVYEDPSVQYPALGSESSLSKMDLSGVTNVVHDIFELKYKAWDKRGSYETMYGPNNCDEARRLYYYGTPICVDLRYKNMAMEHVLTALLLRNHYPALPQFEERVTYSKGYRFSNSRGGNPFAVLGLDVSGVCIEIIGKDNETVGAVKVSLPWSYGIIDVPRGLDEVLNMAIGRMFEMIYGSDEQIGTFNGIIRYQRNGASSKAFWVE